VIRQVNDDADGNPVEFWSARELMPLLEYDEWRNFVAAIERAKTTCRNVNQEPDIHFRSVATNNPGANGRGRPGTDVQLSRFGCYLVAMNGDPTKRAIASAQTYFAVQTYRAEQALPQPHGPSQSPPTPAVQEPRPWAERFRRTFMPHAVDLFNSHPGCFSVVSGTHFFPFVAALYSSNSMS
jgi:DNA-damage-inducible protein D